MNAIIKTILLDLGIFAGAIIIFFLLFVCVKAIQNGKKHNLTNDNIFSYSLRLFPNVADRWIRPLLKWALIAFIIHIIITVFNTFGDYIASVVTYEKIPVLALIFDIFKGLIPLVMPFLLPAIVIILIFIIGYGIIGTLHQVSKNNVEMDKMAQFSKTLEPEVANSKVIDGQFVTQSKEIIPAPTVKKIKKQKKDAYKPTKKELFSYFSENVHKAFLAILKFLPKVLVVVVILVGLNSAIVSITRVTDVVDNVKHIKELNMAIKNLSNSNTFARITMLDETPTSNDIPIKRYRIEILSKNGDVISSQELSLRGKEIVLDSININFDYSEISEGGHYNIAYPYRVYSELVTPANAVELTCVYNDENVPVMYSLENNDILGMKRDVYYRSVKEIFNIIKDDAASKEMGIRSTIGNAVHINMKKNDIINVNIEGTGGISISKYNSLYNIDNPKPGKSDNTKAADKK